MAFWRTDEGVDGVSTPVSTLAVNKQIFYVNTHFLTDKIFPLENAVCNQVIIAT